MEKALNGKKSLRTPAYRVLFVCDAFWPYLGGAEISALAVLSHLSKKGLEILVLTHGFHGTKSRELHENLRIFRKRLFSPSSLNPLTIDAVHRLLFYFKAAVIISNYVRKIKPDIILTQQLVSISTILVAKLFRIPVVVIVHDYWPICYNRNLILKYCEKICSCYDTSFSGIYECAKNEFPLFLRQSLLRPFFAALYSTFIFGHTLVVKQLLKKANAIITVSHFVRKALILNGFDSGKVHVIYNPIIIKNQLKKHIEEVPYILYVGRLDIEKGVRFLLEAMQRIFKCVGPVNLIIVGKGSDEKRLRFLAKNLQIEQNIKFLGRISDDFLSRLYKSSAVVVVPSIWPEPFGRVVAEAMMYNRPVIASHVGGIPELINRRNGILIPPGDSEALADAIVRAIRNKISCDNWSTMHEKFYLDYIADQYLALIKSVA